MKIRVAILDRDVRYLEKLMSAFLKDYFEKIEIYSYTNYENAVEGITNEKINVFLTSTDYEVASEDIPKNCEVAYLVDTKDIETYKGVKAVCKYQTVEALYKNIVNLFSNVATDITAFAGLAGNACNVYGFMSASGGTGSSTAAAACAMHLAKAGKKVVYLNYETLGDPNLYFSAQGSETFRDVIFALKSKKGNLALKLAATVKRDKSGVEFFATVPLALDFAELTVKESIDIIKTLKDSGSYEYIVVDMDFSLEKDSLMLMNELNELIIISDGSPISNSKLKRAIDSLKIIEEQMEIPIFKNTAILYNRFSSKVSSKIVLDGIKELGGIKRYEGYEEAALLEELSSLPVFDVFIAKKES
ncbi:MAG: chromosome partitioning protein ParA [Lachnospiraceae bacterium]|nr:chromosome partitioning protein ParA [Lachnospiraceae bacterium]